jgi:hypothetical protein
MLQRHLRLDDEVGKLIRINLSGHQLELGTDRFFSTKENDTLVVYEPSEYFGHTKEIRKPSLQRENDRYWYRYCT